MRPRWILAVAIALSAAELAPAQPPPTASLRQLASARPQDTPGESLPLPDQGIAAGIDVERSSFPDGEDMGQPQFGPCFWLGADYMMWWVKGSPMPTPLATTGPATDPFPGAMDQPDTTVLYGGRTLDYEAFSGFHAESGLWLDGANTTAIEFGGFLLSQRTLDYQASGGSDGQSFFGRPFVNARTGNQNLYFISQNFADPILAANMTGDLAITNSLGLWGWEINLTGLCTHYSTMTYHTLAGFRALGLDETLRIGSNIRNLSAGGGGAAFLGSVIDPPQNVDSFDEFRAASRFYGPQFGGRMQWEHGCWRLGLLGKVALGVSQQMAAIEGASTLRNGNATVVTVPGGTFALASNIGRHVRNEFGVIPEGRIDLEVHLTQHLDLRIGYNFLYWNQVLRSGDTVDPTVNPSLVPTDLDYGLAGGPAQPGFRFHSSDFWAHGVSFGLTGQY